MSGHNKWSKIKNAKEKNDQQNAKMFTKIAIRIANIVVLVYGYCSFKRFYSITFKIYGSV